MKMHATDAAGALKPVITEPSCYIQRQKWFTYAISVKTKANPSVLNGAQKKH